MSRRQQQSHTQDNFLCVLCNRFKRKKVTWDWGLGYERSHKPEPYAPKQGTCSCLSLLCTHTCCRTSRNLGQRYTGHSSRALSSNPHLHGSGFYGVNYERAITCRRPTHAKRRPPTFYYIVHSPPPPPSYQYGICCKPRMQHYIFFIYTPYPTLLINTKLVVALRQSYGSYWRAICILLPHCGAWAERRHSLGRGIQ